MIFVKLIYSELSFRLPTKLSTRCFLWISLLINQSKSHSTRRLLNYYQQFNWIITKTKAPAIWQRIYIILGFMLHSIRKSDWPYMARSNEVFI
ncbi:FlaD/FlaE family flagellar protein [Vibrio ichthyoenteri]|uniref:FlaD/FlaE family flagellar protein n=1 Tax=Vibrio ichthyoenteri TaxID=142461 RepID=UPI001110D708